jgi:hypothetical protein
MHLQVKLASLEISHPVLHVNTNSSQFGVESNEIWLFEDGETVLIPRISLD